MEWFLKNLTKASYYIDIDPFNWRPELPLVIDIETDEKDNFVGLALCQESDHIYYYTKLIDYIKRIIPKSKLIGHNLKQDLHWLKMYGFDVSVNNLHYDTMIASYVKDYTKESHSLKNLANEYLGLSYPTYKELVGKGKNKITLDKQPLEVVANYCALDCYATLKLHEFFIKNHAPKEREVFNGLEMPLNRILYQIEDKGVKIDTNKLKEFDGKLGSELASCFRCLYDFADLKIKNILTESNKFIESYEISCLKKWGQGLDFNPSSWQQKKFLLNQMGYSVKSSDKKEIVKYQKDSEFIQKLLRYSELSKLNNAFVKPLLETKTLPYIHTTYSQIAVNNTEDSAKGIRTGRLSSSAPNLQQIPARTDLGKELREIFIPHNENQILWVFDYNQIELVLAAHFSGDKILMNAFLHGEDIHDVTAKELGVCAKSIKILMPLLFLTCSILPISPTKLWRDFLATSDGIFKVYATAKAAKAFSML